MILYDVLFGIYFANYNIIVRGILPHSYNLTNMNLAYNIYYNVFNIFLNK